MSSPLAASSLLASLPSLVDDAPTLKSPVEALTLLLHATHIALGFRLAPASRTGGEGSKLSAEALKKGEVEYKHAQSSLTFIVRVGKLGGRAVVDAMAVEDDKPHHLSFPLASKVAPESSFPYPLASPSADKPLAHVYLSEQSLEGVVREFKTEIVDKLVPSLEGKPMFERQGSGGRGDRQQVNPPGIPAQPEHGGGSQGFRGLPPTHPSIGSADLDPLAASPNAFRPPSLFGGGQPRAGGQPGGMMMDPSQFPSHPGATNPSPYGFHPPGARWDPITPFQPPGGGGGGFHPGQPRGGAFGGEPDNDEFLPPGMEGGNSEFGIRFPGQHRGGGQGGAGGRGGFGSGGFGGFA